ncbi:MAG TPA: aminoacyl-histidine dipeptidase [bacterium]|jgi:dipeptidase D|nr:aminoacyl-histidine dipeptidase [bacterium]HQI04967.1 aminoacyl-histidine dipeptidase [bacterium]HQN73140.1 aminoacyl-histidine dipeptidase [bacterium]HQO91987.1 aminoacyl-histidine dipeptidase [bacterium]
MNSRVKKILDLFEEINKVPRKSKNEAKISQWLMDWAEKHGFEAERDEVMNVLIKVPATAGYENKPVIVFQGHMDMVCEKTPESRHDFSKDPIKHVYNGDWLKADCTTLGADNGIALAIALELATDKTVLHPPMELLFTVDEETGLTGANALKPGWLKGKVLLNLDSEDEGIFTVGCAGGRDTKINFKPEWVKPCSECKNVEIKVAGLSGGHSGVDIKLQRGNANQILARILDNLAASCELKIVSIDGGSAHNAIPRDAFSIISVKKDDLAKVSDIVEKTAAKIKAEFKKTDPDMTITVKEMKDLSDPVMSNADSIKLINMMMSMPHGVAAMSGDIEGLVETSSNFATVKMSEGVVSLLSSQRSSVASRIEWITRKVEKSAFVADAEFKSGNGYPGWEPDMESGLLAKCISIYEKLYGTKPVVEVIHAGLECGIIGSKNEGMEMISYGPTIKNPHSPDEKMFVPSIEKIWDFTVELLKSYC